MTIEFVKNIENNSIQGIKFPSLAREEQVNNAPTKDNNNYKVVNLSAKRFQPGGDSALLSEIHTQEISMMMLGSL